MAKSKYGRPKAKKANTHVSKWSWFLLLPILFFALPSVLLIIVAMLPTLGAALSDRRTEKYAALCVGGFNLCATVPYLIRLWSRGHDMQGFMAFVTDIWAWLVIYGVSALGWGFFWLVPYLLTRFSNWHSKRELTRLRDRQQELLDEWGVELAQAVEEADAAGPVPARG